MLPVPVLELAVLVGEVRLTFGGGGERLKRILGCASSVGKEHNEMES